jgi:ATP-dependent RNA helicase DHX57
MIIFIWNYNQKSAVCFGSNSQLNINGNNTKLLTAILCAALYPNVVKVLTPEKSYTHSAMGALPKRFLADGLQFKTRDNDHVSNAPYVMHDLSIQ